MSLDPINPGAMPLASMSMTKAQARKLAEIVERYDGENRLGPIRLETLPDAYMRAVLIGPDGDPVDEVLLFPV